MFCTGIKRVRIFWDLDWPAVRCSSAFCVTTVYVRKRIFRSEPYISGMATNGPNDKSILVDRIQHEIRRLALLDLEAISAGQYSAVRNLFEREVTISRRAPLLPNTVCASSLCCSSDQIQ